MNRFFFLALAILLPHLSLTADEELRVLVVVGTAGTDEYDEVFSKNADLWKTAAERGGAAFTRIEKEKGGSTPVEQIEKTIAEVEEPSLWIVLIGHGSFDSRAVKFNLHGPDFTDDELAKWVQVGASPRATIALDAASRARAWLRGQDFVSPEDVQAVAPACLAHRIHLSYEAEAEGKTREDVVNAILERVAVT